MPKDPVTGRWMTDDEYSRARQRRAERKAIGEKARMRVQEREAREAAMGKKPTLGPNAPIEGSKPRPSKPKSPPVSAGKPKTKPTLPPESEDLVRTLRSPLTEGIRRIRGR